MPISLLCNVISHNKSDIRPQCIYSLPCWNKLHWSDTTLLIFVQPDSEPDSEQQCLLGMCATPLLGISILRANGQLTAWPSDEGCLCPVGAVHNHSQSQKAFSQSTCWWWIPYRNESLLLTSPWSLSPLGLCTQESLVTVCTFWWYGRNTSAKPSGYS